MIIFANVNTNVNVKTPHKWSILDFNHSTEKRYCLVLNTERSQPAINIKLICELLIRERHPSFKYEQSCSKSKRCYAQSNQVIISHRDKNTHRFYRFP